MDIQNRKNVSRNIRKKISTACNFCKTIFIHENVHQYYDLQFTMQYFIKENGMNKIFFLD